MSTIDRKLAYVVKIDNIFPINGADKIECAQIKGWNVVVNKGVYTENSLAIFCEIDSWIPTHIAPYLSNGKEPKSFNGISGERLKTKKLKGVISQGLLLPFSVIMSNCEGECASSDWNVGDDVTGILGIQKWEKPIPPTLRGEIKGNFPTHLVPRTDQERIQNCAEDIFRKMCDGYDIWHIQEKIDGSSCTFLIDENGEFIVCSRNLALKKDNNNAFWKAVSSFEDPIRDIMNETGEWLAFQGELISSGIQGNPYKLKEGESQFLLFDIYNINKKSYMDADDVYQLAAKLGIRTVPKLMGYCFNPNDGITNHLDMCKLLLDWSDGKSVLNDKTDREGIVLKSKKDPNTTFKVISNVWLQNE